MEENQKKKFQAFISYKHSVSGRIAAALETALRRYAKPIFRPPISIFRDEDQMSAGVDLKASIRNALEDSDYLIYIATREAAESLYVREELEIWCSELDRQNKLIIVWQKDGLKDNPLQDSVLWEESNALPRNLEHHVQGIPIWIDLTWAASDEDLNLRNPRFKMLVNSIIARFRGIPPEELTGDEIRTHRRNIRIRNTAICVLTVLLIVSIMAITRAYTERQEARINLLTYRSSQFMDSDSTLALRFAYEAYALAKPGPSIQIKQLLIRAFYQDDAEKAWRYITKLYHGGGLKDAILSSDGQYVLTLSSNGSAMVWSIDGDHVGNMTMKNGIVGAQFSADSQLLLTTGYMDETVSVWRMDGSLYDDIEVPVSENPFAEFSPGGRQVLVLSGNPEPKVTVWDPKGNKIVIQEKDVCWARFTPDGNRILTYTGNRMVRCWTPTGQYKGYFKISGNCKRMEISPDGQFLLAMPNQKTLELWGINGEFIGTCDGQGRQLTALAVSKQGNSIVTAYKDGTISLWDRGGQLVSNCCEHPNGVQSCRFSPDGQRILTVSNDNTARIWDLGGNLIGICKGQEQRVTAARFSPDGESILTASGDGTAKMWKAPQEAVSILRTHANRVNRVEFFPDSNRLLTQSMDGRVEIWSLDGELLPSRLAKETQIKHVKLSPAGIHIITAAVDQNTIKLWNKDGEFLKTLKGHNAPVEDFEFSPDGQYIISASKAQNAIIWDKAGHLFPICKPYAGKIQSARFLPDGSGILAFCKDGKFRILDFEGKVVPSDLEKEEGLETSDFSPKGRFIKCVLNDNSVKIFNLAGKQALSHRGGGTAPGFWFLPDESGYVKTTPGGHVTILDMQGNIRSQWRRPSESRYHSARVAPDSKKVVIPQSGEIRDVKGNLLGNIPDIFVDFFPDSDFILTASRDETSTIHIRDLNGQLVVSCGTILKENYGPAKLTTGFSRDRQRFAVASEDGTVKIWRTASGIFHYLKSTELYRFNSEDYSRYGIEWMR